jgi:hypothetical protein
MQGRDIAASLTVKVPRAWKFDAAWLAQFDAQFHPASLQAPVF